MKTFEERVKEVLEFAKEKGIGIEACQEIDQQNRIHTVPLFRDLAKKEE